jgi:hypothetical protein
LTITDDGAIVVANVCYLKEELIMSRAKGAIVMIAVILSVLSIIFAILDTVSLATTTVFLGVAIIVLSAAILQK